MTITLKIRPLDRKVRTSVYLVKSRRGGKLRNGEKVCLGKPVEKDGRFNYAVYKVNDANSVVGNLGNITTDQRDLSGEENKSQKLNELDESVWNELKSPELKKSDDSKSKSESPEKDEIGDESPEKEEPMDDSPEKDEPSDEKETSDDEKETSDDEKETSDDEKETDEPESPRSAPSESPEERSPTTQELFKSTAGSAKNARRGNKKTQKILPLKKIIPLHM